MYYQQMIDPSGNLLSVWNSQQMIDPPGIANRLAFVEQQMSVMSMKLDESNKKYDAILPDLIHTMQNKIDEMQTKLQAVHEELSRLQTRLNETLVAAEHGEFLLFIQKELTIYEFLNCHRLPHRDDYVQYVRLKDPSITQNQILSNIHFRRWLWILLDGDENLHPTIGVLRQILQDKGISFIQFADRMRSVYSYFGHDIPSRSPLDIKYMKVENIPTYVKFFKGHVREAIEIFCDLYY